VDDSLSVCFGVSWVFEDHKVSHFLPLLKGMLLADGMIDEVHMDFTFQLFVMNDSSLHLHPTTTQPTGPHGN
jgi:hypothetical protein